MADETIVPAAPVTDPGSTQPGQGQASVEATPGLAAAAAAPAPEKIGTADKIGLSKEELSTIVRESVSAVAARDNTPQETPEQLHERFNSTFNVYRFNAEKLSKLGYSPEQIAEIMPIYEDMRDGFVKQAVTMSNYQLTQLEQRLQKQMAPFQEVVQKQMETRLREEFMTENADLKGFEPLLEMIKERYVRDGFQFKSTTPDGRKKELFKAIADEARNTVAQVRGNGGGTTVPAAGTTPPSSQRMSTVSAGGQGGAGGLPAGNGTKESSTAKAIFG